MIKQLLRPVGFILLNFPEIGSTVEIAFVAFNFHLAHRQEWNCFKAVLVKDGFCFSMSCVENDAKESWNREFALVMIVGVRSASQLTVDILALFTT